MFWQDVLSESLHFTNNPGRTGLQINILISIYIAVWLVYKKKTKKNLVIHGYISKLNSPYNSLKWCKVSGSQCSKLTFHLLRTCLQPGTRFSDMYVFSSNFDKKILRERIEKYLGA